MGRIPSYQRILVATDFSPHAAAALKQAIWIAKETGGRILLAHVLPNVVEAVCRASDSVHVGGTASDEEFQREMRRTSDVRMQRLIDELHLADLEIQSETLLGEPFVEIIHAVQAEGYDLVLAGTRGIGPWKQFLIGSTSKRLIRKCPSAVWIVKEEHVRPPKTILVPIDFSEVSRRAALAGLWIADHAAAKCHFLHVIESIDEPQGIVSDSLENSSFRREKTAAARQGVDEFIRSLDINPAAIHAHVSWGSPWWEICRYAEYLKIDLISMGTVGRSGIKGLFLGNTAEKVLTTCPCSILTVKPADFVSPIMPAFWPLHPPDKK